jgi:hypothetical protein
MSRVEPKERPAKREAQEGRRQLNDRVSGNTESSKKIIEKDQERHH